MRRLVLLASITLAGSPAALASPRPAPLIGDVVHGESLLTSSSDGVRVDGAWLNAFSEEEAVARLGSGKDGFPRVESDNVLDRWDVLAFIKGRNTNIGDLLMGGDTILVSATTLDDNAEQRLREQARIPASSINGERRVFSVYKLGGPGEQDASFSIVHEKDTKKRDLLKKNTKVGYVVFVKLAGFRGGDHEAAFAVDKDIRIQEVVIRTPQGDAPADLNQAAARFVGKGARGQYGALKAGGAGKAITELEKPLSDAFLLGMESVYMYEVGEREYFAFDN